MPRDIMVPFIAVLVCACTGTAVANTGAHVADVVRDCRRGNCSPLTSDADEQLQLMQVNARLSVRPGQPIAGEEVPLPGGEAPVPAQQDPIPAQGLPTTSTLNKAPQSGAEASGVTVNGAGDLEAFIAATISNVGFVAVCVGFFMTARSLYPFMYCNNVLLKVQTYEIPDRWFGWARAALGISTDEIVETVGLDQAMLIEFSMLCMRILATFGLPMICIIGPLNYAYGGNAAGDDYLSYLSFGNVEDGSWLYWVHAFVIWGVVYSVQAFTFNAMQKFVNRRIDWLESLPLPRAATVMVEGIPEDYQSDERLKVHFSKLFGHGKVKSAYIAKRAFGLKRECRRKAAAKKEVESAYFRWDQVGRDPDKKPRTPQGADVIQYYEEEVSDAHQAALEALDRAKKHLPIPGGVNGCNGFVTFNEPADADVALCMQIGSDQELWVLSVPPPPKCVVWSDLEQDSGKRFAWTVLGYLLTFGLYMLYLPSVIWITTIANKIEMSGALQSVWEGLAPTLGLLFMVCFLPSFLVFIFKLCFTLNDEAKLQLLLQNWYFVFQFVFVILVTAIGDSLFLFMKTLVVSPLEIMPILATTMPQATHFYMNFMVLSWASHALNLTRYMNLSKFFVFRKVTDQDRAVQMAEPEDQDYYGIGSRHARFSIMMCIGIIFGTLSPPIPILTFINFFLCRLFYGYLIPFAETKKPDIGGKFFVQACKHLLFGCLVYVLLMTGVLYARASTGGPATISVVAVGFVIWSLLRFDIAFQCETLPFEERLKEKTRKKHLSTGENYIQPEWKEFQ